jgi:hypothetical protein
MCRSGARRRKMVTSLNRAATETDLNRLALIFQVMVAEFGGMVKFIAAWKET